MVEASQTVFCPGVVYMVKLKSRPLIAGSRIGIIAPASPVKDSREYQAHVEYLVSSGYQVILGKTAIPGRGFLAGDDRTRQLDLESMWQDDSIAAVWCLRGGYGCLRLLSRLNYRFFEKKPKILMGFSDITALELAFWARMKLVTFHGPVLTTFASDFTRQSALKMLSGMQGDEALKWPGRKQQRLIVIRGGKAEGPLLGGNLTTIAAMAGTGYLPDFSGCVLFIEEVQEAAYRVDRLLTQLIYCGVMDGLRGIVIGKSIPIPGETEADLVAVFRERLEGLGCPVAYGFPIGHLEDQWTLPQGLTVSVDMDEGILYLKESPFISADS